MNLKSRHQVDPTFNMSSMTDIVFLLLIFFMLTSSFVTPTSLPVNVPQASGVITQNEKVKLVITKELRYYIDEEEIPFVDLRNIVKQKLGNPNVTDDVVVIKADEEIKLGDALKVVGLLKELKVKVSFEVKPQD